MTLWQLEYRTLSYEFLVQKMVNLDWVKSNLANSFMMLMIPMEIQILQQH